MVFQKKRIAYFGGPAIVAALFLAMPSGQARAVEKITLELKGEYTSYFGYAKNDDIGTGDFTGFDVKLDSESEIEFEGETTLDNGLEIGVAVGLKPQSSDDEQIDGSYLFITSDNLGRIEIGQNDNIAVLMQGGEWAGQNRQGESNSDEEESLSAAAPDVGLRINDSDIADWIINPSNGDENSAFQSTFLYIGDEKSTKLTWASPRLAGLQIGVTYIPEFEADNNAQPQGDLYRDGIVVAANYVRKFASESEFKVAAGFLAADSPSTVTGGADAEGYSLGFALKVDKITIGGSYANTDGNPEGGTDPAISFDGVGFDIGVAYELTNNMNISLSYYRGEFEDQVALAGDSTNDTVMASVNYEAGHGVEMLASLFHSRFAADTGVKNEGVAFITGLKLEF